jgi:hypothetical protein
MQITVNISERIVNEARAQGVAVEEFVEQLLAGERANQEPVKDKSTRPEIEALLKAMAAHSDKIPPLPETITREWIYQDHD